MKIQNYLKHLIVACIIATITLFELVWRNQDSDNQKCTCSFTLRLTTGVLIASRRPFAKLFVFVLLTTSQNICEMSQRTVLEKMIILTGTF